MRHGRARKILSMAGTRRHWHAMLLVGTAMGCAIVAPAWGQTLPPYQNVDANGVDLVTGQFVFSLTEGAIGSGEGAVSLRRGARPDQWSGLIYRKTLGGQSLEYVQLGSISDTFTISGSTYTPTKANGATFAYIGQNTYRYTAPDGTKIDYKTIINEFLDPEFYVVDGPGCQNGDPGTCGIPVSITKPDGMVFTLNWTFDKECGGHTLPCPDPKAYFRFRGVTSSTHYSFGLTYLTDDPGNFNAPQSDWYIRTGASFTNTVNPPSPPRTVSYAHPSSGVEELTDAAGRVWRFTASGNTYGIRRPGSTSDDIVVTSGTGGLTSSVQKDGVTTTYNRTVSGTTATMTVTDSLAHVTTIVTDLTKGRPTSITDALGNETDYAYDSHGRLTKITYPEGNYVQYTLDSRGNIEQTTQVSKTPGTPADIVVSAHYPSSCANVVTCNKPIWTKDAKGNQTDYGYDSTTGQTLTVTAPAPVTNGAQPTTTYGYTSVGGVSLVHTISTCASAATCAGTANETKTTIAYNTNGLPSSATQAAGDGSVSATTAYTYTAVGDVATTDGPLSGTADTTTYRYDLDRELTGIISADPDGAGALERRAQKRTYNANGQVTETEIGTVTGTGDTAWAAFVSKQQLATSYDANSRKTRDVLTAGGSTYGVTDYSYDSLGRLDCTAVRMNSAAWGTVTPACTAQTVGSAGPDRITRVAAYDALNRATAVTTAYGQSYASTESTAYTDSGRVQSVTDAEGNKTAYVYDGFDRLAKIDYPDPAQGSGSYSSTDYEQYAYDANGNLTERRLRGYHADQTQKITYVYDHLNRLVTKNLPGGEPDVTYAYDLLGRPTSGPPPGQARAVTDDALSRLLTETGPQGTLSSTWDAGGRRTKLEWPDGFYVSYDYDVLGEMTRVRENGATSGVGVLASYTYDDLGDRTGATYGNGTTSIWTPDPLSRLHQLVHNLAGAASDLTRTFAYNPADQIASVTSSNDAYAWDAAANVNRDYTTNGLNQYTLSGSTALGYDARGNLTSSGADSYTYSSENLLETGPGSTTLSYDPLLRLYQVAQGSTTTRFAYDGLEMIAEYDGSNVLQHRYVFGPGMDEPIVQYTGTGTASRRWLHADERGSVIALTTASGGTTIDSYDEYGIPGTGNTGRFQYTGQMWIPEIGLYYYKARFYSPSLGRFMQTDPIGYADGLNWYNYVGSDPINFIDPLGLNHFGPITLADGTQCTAEYDDNGAVKSLEEDCYNPPDVSVTVGGGRNFGGLHFSPGPTSPSATFRIPQGQWQICTANAHGVQNNLPIRAPTRKGAYGVPETPGTAAIDRNQWLPSGSSSWSSMKKNAYIAKFRTQVSGYIPKGKIYSKIFGEISDNMGPASGVNTLEQAYPNRVLFELPGGKDLGDVNDMIFVIPKGLACPHP